MKLEINIEDLAERMLSQVEAEFKPDIQRELENYWSIILLDNLPDLEKAIKEELKKKGFNL